MTETEYEDKPKKPKRRLKSIDFSGPEAHLALVGPAVGGPANGADYILVAKSVRRINKADDSANPQSDSEVLISESDASTNASVEKSNEVTASVKPTNKETLMKIEAQEVDAPKVVVEEVQVEKAVDAAPTEMEMLQKSMQEQKVELQKALDQIKAFEKEKQEQVIKSKTSAITAVVKDSALQAPIVKAALALQDQKDFDSFVTALTSMTAQIEKSALFTEVGSAAEPEVEIKANPVASLLKSKYAAK